MTTQDYCPNNWHLLQGWTVQEYNDSKYRPVYKKQQSSFASAEGVEPTQ